MCGLSRRPCRAPHGSVRLEANREALNDRGVHDGVRRYARLSLFEEYDGVLHTALASERVKHAPEPNMVWLHGPFHRHLAP